MRELRGGTRGSTTVSRRAVLIALALVLGVLYPPIIVTIAAFVMAGAIIYVFFWSVIEFDRLMPKFESDPHFE